MPTPKKYLRWEEQADGSPVAVGVLYNEAELAQVVARLGHTIYMHYRLRNINLPLVVVGVLKGCLPFLADLLRQIKYPVTVEFISAASYGDATTPGDEVRLSHIPSSLHGKHVLVVDDIMGTGATLTHILDVLRDQEPLSLEACVLIDKPTDAKGRVCERSIVPHFVGIRHTGVDFVVGYGLGMGEDLRHLPYIGRIIPPGEGTWLEDRERLHNRDDEECDGQD